MRLLLALLISMSARFASAAIVFADSHVFVDPVAEGVGTQFGTHKLTVLKDPIGHYTIAWLSITPREGSGAFDLKFVSYLLDEGSDWFLVSEGESFTRQGIKSLSYTQLLNTFGNPALNPSVVVGNEFYLGVNTGAYGVEPGREDFEDRDALGWVKFAANYSVDDETGKLIATLEKVDNVMSYDSPGVIVGTTTVVPESPTLALGSVALLSLAAVRRRR